MENRHGYFAACVSIPNRGNLESCQDAHYLVAKTRRDRTIRALYIAGKLKVEGFTPPVVPAELEKIVRTSVCSVGLWPYLAGSFRSHGCQPFVGAVVRFRRPIGHSFGRRPCTKGVPSLQAILLGLVSLGRQSVAWFRWGSHAVPSPDRSLARPPTRRDIIISFVGDFVRIAESGVFCSSPLA